MFKFKRFQISFNGHIYGLEIPSHFYLIIYHLSVFAVTTERNV